MMKKIFLIAILGASVAGITGCKANTDAVDTTKAQAPAAQAPADQEKKDDGMTEAEKERHQRDLIQAKKLADQGQLIPPKSDVRLEIVSINGNLSHDDAARSYEFRKSAIKRCYRVALSYDLEAAGEATMTLRHEAQGKSIVENLKTTVTAGEMESCLLDAAKTWPLPAGVTMDIKLIFTAEKPKTLKDLREADREEFKRKFDEAVEDAAKRNGGVVADPHDDAEQVEGVDEAGAAEDADANTNVQGRPMRLKIIDR